MENGEIYITSFDDEEALPSSIGLLECSHVRRHNVPNINPDVTIVGRQLLLAFLFKNCRSVHSTC